jgi:hypothetical protein
VAIPRSPSCPSTTASHRLAPVPVSALLHIIIVVVVVVVVVVHRLALTPHLFVFRQAAVRALAISERQLAPPRAHASAARPGAEERPQTEAGGFAGAYPAVVLLCVPNLQDNPSNCLKHMATSLSDDRNPPNIIFSDDVYFAAPIVYCTVKTPSCLACNLVQSDDARLPSLISNDCRVATTSFLGYQTTKQGITNTINAPPKANVGHSFLNRYLSWSAANSTNVYDRDSWLELLATCCRTWTI